jgi:hypothetical protein
MAGWTMNVHAAARIDADERQLRARSGHKLAGLGSFKIFTYLPCTNDAPLRTGAASACRITE